MTFKLGESGNLAGRPAGARNKRTQLARLLEPYAEELIQKAVELARSGDINALRLCIERLIPKATQEPISLDFDPTEINKIEYLMSFSREILIAVSNGEITPVEGKVLSGVADIHRRCIENGEMRTMLEDIQTAIKRGAGK